jgi:hypothetical protein
MVDYENLANLLTGIALILSAIGPLAMMYRVKIPRVRNLTFILCTFLVLHAIYHLTYYFRSYWLSLEVLGPISILAVIIFAIYLYQTTFPSSQHLRNSSAVPVAAGAAVVGAYAIPTIGPNISAVMLFISFAIFVAMFAKYPSVKSLHFQFTVFLSIWALSEAVFSLQQSGFNLGPLAAANIGVWAHFASMAAMGIFVNYRFFGIWKGVRKAVAVQESIAA